MTLLKRKRVLAAKIETTTGTAIALTGSDGTFNAYDVVIQPNIAMTQREGQGGFGMLASYPEGMSGKATFKIDVSWDGVGVPVWASTFLPACGMVATGNIYKPKTEAPSSTSSVKTLTIGCYVDGVFKSIRGASGTVKLVCKTGSIAVLEFDFTGVWVPPTAVAIIAPTYSIEPSLRYATSTTTWNSVGLCLESITLDFGNTVTLRECATTVQGFDNAIITNRNPKVTANPEAKLLATQDRFGQWIASTEGILTWNFPGGAASTFVVVSVPKAQLMNCQEGDRNGLVTDELEFSCNRNGSTVDEEFSIEFDEA